MKNILIALITILSTQSIAGSWAAYSVPTGIDIVTRKGFMVYGAFASSENCTFSDRFFVEVEHPQYSEIYSAVLAAYMSGKKIQPYISICKTQGWYVTAEKTFQTVTTGSVNFRH